MRNRTTESLANPAGVMDSAPDTLGKSNQLRQARAATVCSCGDDALDQRRRSPQGPRYGSPWVRFLRAYAQACCIPEGQPSPSRWFGEGLRQWRRPSRASSVIPHSRITGGTAYGGGGAAAAAAFHRSPNVPYFVWRGRWRRLATALEYALGYYDPTVVGALRRLKLHGIKRRKVPEIRGVKKPFFGLQKFKPFVKQQKVLLCKDFSPLCIPMAPENALFWGIYARGLAHRTVHGHSKTK